METQTITLQNVDVLIEGCCQSFDALDICVIAPSIVPGHVVVYLIDDAFSHLRDAERYIPIHESLIEED
jgi:hypothetical protein